MRAAKPLAAAAIVWAMPVVAHPPERHAIEHAMAESATGWNTGDIDRFLAIYSDAPATSFVTKDRLIRGKAAMRARYTTHYDFTDAAKRGMLSFTTLDFRLLDPTHALYIGRYTLTHPNGKADSGPTTLIFAKEAGGWKIIADHSS